MAENLASNAADDPAAIPGRILVGKGERYEYLLLPLGNRHGLVAGATGTGKTVTLQVLAEGFSRAGVAVFAADVKGDLAGLSMPGDGKPAFVAARGRTWPRLCAGRFSGRLLGPLRRAGPPDPRHDQRTWGRCCSRACWNSTRFRKASSTSPSSVADESGLLLHRSQGSARAAAACRRNRLRADDALRQCRAGHHRRHPAAAFWCWRIRAATQFFGEPALDIADFLRVDKDGRGVINLLAAEKLMRAPRLYATFLLWMLSELFEKLPEVGDLEKPKLVFFFDEAHLLFDGAPKSLLAAIDQVVRLIRSKGVGVYFVTQNPLDLPETVLGQLGNRVQHALRAFTPRDQKAVKAAADTFRQNPAFNTAEAITQLGVGEALVSMLGAGGTPEIVARALIAPPAARVGTITEDERKALIAKSALLGKYDTPIDRVSAFEVLQGQAAGKDAGSAAPASGGWMDALSGLVGGLFGGKAVAGKRQRMSPAEIAMRSAVQSAARSAGTQIAHAIMRGVLGGRSK